MLMETKYRRMALQQIKESKDETKKDLIENIKEKKKHSHSPIVATFLAVLSFLGLQ
jgi:hypothetical protein